MTSVAVDVCVDVPRLELDRPFTYLLPDGIEDATGHLVSVPFHGRTVKGWVLGPAAVAPERVLPVRRVLSSVALFREQDLRLYRWVAERYIAPLATVIGRAHPPRVASEEEKGFASEPRPTLDTVQRIHRITPGYENASTLLGGSVGSAASIVSVRPSFDHEATICVEAVDACLSRGGDAIVVVPEAEPLPATARAVLDAFGETAVAFVGGDDRVRYRIWLDILHGRYRVVVGTRPAVFAPVPIPGLVWINREAHPGHREERSPYYTTREVAIARARVHGALCVLSALSPSAETAALVDDGTAVPVRLPRDAVRAEAPLVETTSPREEGRSPRLAERLRTARSGFLLLSRRGYGVARLCKACREPARCAACSGTISRRGGRDVCVVCGADAVCASCGATAFGIERGGTERLQEWAARVVRRPVSRIEEGAQARAPDDGIVVGTAAAVKDFGPLRLDLVALLDPDRARRRPRMSAPEEALATWFEAASWAGPRIGPGRVLVQTREAGDPAIQALVRWDPMHFHRAERRRRQEAGFPPGCPVFRIRGSRALPGALRELQPVTLLESSAGDEAICLVAVRPDRLGLLRERVRSLVEERDVSRVEAEPHL